MKIVRRTLWILIAILIVMLFLKPKEKEILLADGTYENCYVIILKDDLMDVLADGSRIKIPCPVEENIEKKDKIADIQVKDNQIVKITWKEGLVEDKVDSLNLTEGWINLSSYGRKNISLSGEMYIKTGEEVRLLQKAGSLLNRDKISCYIYMAISP